MSMLGSIGYFIFFTIFTLLIILLWFRIALRYTKISSLHPVSHSIHKLSDPIVMPLAKLLPISKGSYYDWPAFILLVLVEFIKFVAFSLLFLNFMMPIGILLLYVAADLIAQPANLLFYAIIIRVLINWINPQWSHPFAEVIWRITDPLLRIGRRIVPNISGFDFSPIVMLVILKIIPLFLASHLPLL